MSDIEKLVHQQVWDAANRVSERMHNDGYLIDSIIAEFEPMMQRTYESADVVNLADDVCNCGHTLHQHEGNLWLRCTVPTLNGFTCPCVDFARRVKEDDGE